ncbi:leukocyte elastase inhibitor-like [Melitaea cinxia]|uniref:leukocyte elastase inhibitor-like n=1 Tax=Melitaea cinxia TaxID=113334 RepID=UPI001E26EC98|nr:leukocyte elastase inhibitor-like [Melitaea cinxia]
MNSIFNIFEPEDFVNITMIMSSAITFESQFKSKFNVSETTVEKYNYNNKTYLFQMMHQTLKLPYSNIPSLNADVMELEFGDDGKFSLLLILPNLRTNMKEVYNKLNTVTLKYVFDKLQSDVDKFGLKEVHLKLPKVKINTKIVLNKPLSNIGLKHILEPEKSEFSGIVSDDLYITTIDHSCEIHIGETGVYAIASTPGYRDMNIFGSDLEAEQPFIFFVMEKTTQTIMLGGLYSKPVYIMN